MHIAAIATMVSCHILTYMTYLSVFIPQLVPICLVVMMLITLGYVAFGIIGTRGLSKSLILFLIVTVVLIAEQYAYTVNFGRGLNLNSIFIYLTIGSVVVFTEARLSLRTKCDIIFTIGVCYCAIYTVFNGQWLALSSSSGKGILSAGDDRGERVILALSYGAFAVSYLLAHFRLDRRYPLLMLAAAVPVVLAIILSNSRLFALSVIAGSVIALLPFGRDLGRRLASLVIFLFFAYSIGCLFTGDNPYKFINNDQSGHSRVVEFELARNFITDHPLVGMGIPSTSEKTDIISVQDPQSANRWKKIGLYATDIGIVGSWLQFGLFGMILVFAAVLVCMTFKGRADSPAETETLKIVGCILGIYSILAITVAGGSGTIIMGLILSETIESKRLWRQRFLPRFTGNRSAERGASRAFPIGNL